MELIVPLIAFALGLISASLIEWLKSRALKRTLLRHLSREIESNILHVQNLITAPTGENSDSGTLLYLKGVDGLRLKDNPEYVFEVANVTSWEKLAEQLVPFLSYAVSHRFLSTLTLARDIETLRRLLKSGDSNHSDYSSYQRMFHVLTQQLATDMETLRDQLRNERIWLSI